MKKMEYTECVFFKSFGIVNFIMDEWDRGCLLPFGDE